MSRLIDANETLKKLKHYGFTSPDMTVTEFIETECPTAYDIDKVVKQLDDYLFDKYCIEGDKKIYEIVKGGAE